MGTGCIYAGWLIDLLCNRYGVVYGCICTHSGCGWLMGCTLLVRVSVCHTGFTKTGIGIVVYAKAE